MTLYICTHWKSTATAEWEMDIIAPVLTQNHLLYHPMKGFRPITRHPVYLILPMYACDYSRKLCKKTASLSLFMNLTERTVLFVGLWMRDRIYARGSGSKTCNQRLFWTLAASDLNNMYDDVHIEYLHKLNMYVVRMNVCKSF